jgi:transcriptional regulator GlxA family with amidase domain
MSDSRRVVILVFEGMQVLDATGPSEVLSLAGRNMRPGTGSRGYALELVAPVPGPVRASSGLALIPDRTIAETTGPLDTLIVVGGQGTRQACENPELMSWVAGAARRSRRVASVCTGAFLLARAGLLGGRRATTHWAACTALQRLHPDIEVQRDPIFVRDGSVYTSAGVTAGIDLTLALVEEDLGRQVALQVARQLVLFIRRPGGQEQFSTVLAGQAAERPSLRGLQAWIADHLDLDLSVAALAKRTYMSERNFSRLFSRQVGVSPASYVQSVRLERARTLLETTDFQLEEIAQRCGFGTVETMRRGFGRRLHLSPSEYRTRFAPTAANVIPLKRRASA